MSYLEKEKEQGKEQLIPSKYPQDGLTSGPILGYALGHVFNDLTAGVWFNFLLFYITKVVHLPP